MNLKDLKKTLAPVFELSNKKMSFEVEGIMFTIRLITETEEHDIFEYTRHEIEEASKDREVDGKSSYDKDVAFYDLFRKMVLAHAICKIDSFDFDAQDFIFDEELGSNIPKVEALKDILSGFTRYIVDNLHNKFAELLKESELDAVNAIKIDEIRAEEMIKLYSEKLDTLKEELERQKTKESNMRDRILENSRINSAIIKQSHEEASSSSTKLNIPNTKGSTPAKQPPVETYPAHEESEDDWSDLEDVEEDYSAQEPEPPRAVRMPAYPPQGNPPPPVRDAHVPTAEDTFLEDSSFFVGDDLEAEAVRENQRLQKLRTQRKQIVVPHAKAAAAQKEVSNTNYNPIGEIDSVPVFAGEKFVHTIPPGKQQTKPNQPPNKPQPAQGAHSNPNFNPHRKG